MSLQESITDTGHKHDNSMSTLAAIYKRRAVRSYLPQKPGRELVMSLLAAAVQAPSAMNEEPWAFAVIQTPQLLREISDAAKALMAPELRKQLTELFKAPDYNIFYNAGTLIVIYAGPASTYAEADCWLAAENLMLAACAVGLGTCVIGLASAILNTPPWKHRLGIPEKHTAYVPLIVGVPAGNTPPVPRKQPQILAWQ